MATIDVIILVIIGAGAVIGFNKGFVKQLASILGLIIGLLAARALYATLAEKLAPMLSDSMSAAQIVSFIAIWIIVPLLFAIVASLLTKALEIMSLGWLNRCLGAVLGAVKYMLLLTIVVWVVEFIDNDHRFIGIKFKQESVFYYPMNRAADIFLPAAKDMAHQYIQDIKDATRRPQ